MEVTSATRIKLLGTEERKDGNVLEQSFPDKNLPFRLDLNHSKVIFVRSL